MKAVNKTSSSEKKDALRRSATSDTDALKGGSLKDLYLDTVKSTLKKLSDSRIKNNHWMDDIRFEDAEHNIAKTMEGLGCLLIAYRLFDFILPSNYVSQETIESDMNSALQIIEKNGFIPYPYTKFEGDIDYADFTAYVLIVCIDYFNYVSKQKLPYDLTLCKKTIFEAKNLLINKNSLHRDEGGIRWSANGYKVVEGKNPHKWANTYFTAWAISGLTHLLDYGSTLLGEDDRDEIINILEQVGVWLKNREVNTKFATDEPRDNFSLVGLNFFVESIFSAWKYLSVDVRNVGLRAVEQFIERLSDPSEIERFEEEITYKVIVDQYIRFNYDDRSTIGTLLSTLCIIKDMHSNSPLVVNNIEKLGDIMSNFASQIIGRRDAEKGVWKNGIFLMYWNQQAIEALIRFAAAGEFRNYTVREDMLIASIREALRDDSVFQTFMIAIRSRIDKKILDEYNRQLSNS